MHLSKLFSVLLPLAAARATYPTSASKGCGKTLPSAFSQSHSTNLTLPGTDRTYLLHLPRGYQASTPHPLYFSFAGASRDATEQEGLSQFSNPLFNVHGIAVYPEGANEHWLSNPSVSGAHPNDLDFINSLVDHLEDLLCIDKSQVYAAGKSNGGGFVGLLACNATVGARFAAFAAVSGAFYKDDAVAGIGPCEPSTRPEGIPFLEFHGTNDSTVPYYGKTGVDDAHSEYTIPEYISSWAERNGCAADAKPKSNVSEYDGLVRHASWDCNGKKGIVQHYRESELGHCWPSTVSNDDFVNNPDQCSLGKYVYNATEIIFDFFGKWKLDV